MKRREFMLAGVGAVGACALGTAGVPAFGAEKPASPIARVFADVIQNLRGWVIRTTSLKAYASKIANAIAMEAMVRDLKLPDYAEIQVYASKAGIHADFIVDGNIQASDVFATNGNAAAAFGNRPVSILMASSARYDEARAATKADQNLQM
jgi:hypothetical protein